MVRMKFISRIYVFLGLICLTLVPPALHAQDTLENFVIDEYVSVTLPEEPLEDIIDNTKVYKAYGNNGKDVFIISVVHVGVSSQEYSSFRFVREQNCREVMREVFRETRSWEALIDEFITLDSAYMHVYGADATVDGLEWGLVGCTFYRAGNRYSVHLLTDRMDAESLRAAGHKFFSVIEINGADDGLKEGESASAPGVQTIIVFGAMLIAIGLAVVIVIRSSRKKQRIQEIQLREEVAEQQRLYNASIQAKSELPPPPPPSNLEQDDTQWAPKDQE